MQNNKTLLSLDLYYKHLTKINGVRFTPREIDVIACILNRRTAAISSFLLIGQRAVESHIRNIRQKAGDLAGRDNIIDFIEKSDKFSLIKNEYYLSLRFRLLFEGKLDVISKKVDTKSFTGLLVYEKGQKYQPTLIPYLKEHLKRVGLETKTHLSEEDMFFTQPNKIINFEQINYVLYICPENTENSHFIKNNMNNLSNIIFLFHQDRAHEDEYKKVKNHNLINMLAKENYYLSFFELLKKLLPHSNFESIIEEFKQQYELAKRSSGIESPQEELNVEKVLPSQPTGGSFLKKIKYGLLMGFIAVMGVLSIWLFIFQEEIEMGSATPSFTPQRLRSPIRSDLILPNETTLLNRPKLMAQIDSKFKGQNGIQALALIGIGGAGKTTVARHYAHQQKANVIWEINAETKGSLNESFEKLAQALAITEEGQKTLRELHQIKNSTEREEKIIHFVKGRLKSQNNWFLIFDNVENLTDIQKYFPQDAKTWGEGKVILTTRNHNVQNSRQVNGIILIEELKPSEKFNLFMQIMSHKENRILTTKQKEKTAEFLKQIPPFPLDISVAAYYLKTLNVPYDAYLERLNQQDKDFTIVQENLLKEAGEYTKTRYSIVTLSLRKLIENHKDFSDLLLIISLLDSQNIPRELLSHYKKDAIVDNFIYHLKKYSLIINESSVPSAGPVLSLHRSTQTIALAYLINVLGIEKSKKLGETFGCILEKDMVDAIDKENYLRMRLLVNHGEKFLIHNNLLTASIKSSLSGELGGMYYYLDDFKKAKTILEKSLEIYKSHAENFVGLARSLGYLGAVYRVLCNKEKARHLLEESLAVYRKHSEFNLGTARVLGWLGGLYIVLGDYQNAINSFEHALVIYQKDPENYFGVARGLYLLGNAYRKLGHYEKARQALEQSLTIYRRHPDHIGIAYPLGFLGDVYRRLGDYEKAKQVLEESLAVYKKRSASEIDIARSLGYLGDVYENLGKPEKAVECLKKSLIIYTKYYPVGHHDIAWVSVLLGNVYVGLGDYKKAKDLLEKSLLNYENYYGKNHIELTRLLRIMGHIYLLDGHIKNAENYFHKALEIFQKHMHSDEYISYEDFAELFLKKELMEKKRDDINLSKSFNTQAINNLKKALEIVKIHFPENSPHVARIQGKLKSLEKGQQ